MPLSFIKELGLVVCCIYCYYHLLNIPNSNNTVRLFIFIMAASLEATIINCHFPYLTFTILIITISIFLYFQSKNNYLLSLTTTIIAFSISYLSFSVAIIIVSLLLVVLFPEYTYNFANIPVFIVQLFLVRVPFLYKRTKKGMPFLTHELYAIPVVIISFIIIIFANIMNNSTVQLFYILPLVLLYITIILIHLYWCNALTKTYIDKLNAKNMEDLNITLGQLQFKIQQLESENKRLARIIHKDNKLIPSMEYAVQTYLQNSEVTHESRQEGASLIDELAHLSHERQGLLTMQNVKCEPLETCGIPRIDHLLQYMQQRAVKDNIHFHVSFSCDIHPLVSRIIDEDMLHTMIADLIENALIATKHNQGRHVFFKIDMIAKSFSVHVLDCGLPFTKEVLLNFGKKPITTHADESGSGIGLMELYQTLKKHHASLYIDEFANSGLYTKKMSVVFNSTNNIVLYTNRFPDETAELSKRTDIIIIHK